MPRFPQDSEYGMLQNRLITDRPPRKENFVQSWIGMVIFNFSTGRSK